MADFEKYDLLELLGELQDVLQMDPEDIDEDDEGRQEEVIRRIQSYLEQIAIEECYA